MSWTGIWEARGPAAAKGRSSNSGSGGSLEPLSCSRVMGAGANNSQPEEPIIHSSDPTVKIIDQGRWSNSCRVLMIEFIYKFCEFLIIDYRMNELISQSPNSALLHSSLLLFFFFFLVLNSPSSTSGLCLLPLFLFFQVTNLVGSSTQCLNISNLEDGTLQLYGKNDKAFNARGEIKANKCASKQN